MPILTLYVFTEPPLPANLQARAYKRGKLNVAEIDLARGPVAEGVTGAGTYAALFGQPWALLLEKSGNLRLLTLLLGVWTQVTPLSPLPVLPVTARHVSMAFDQAARPAIAWQDGNTVYFRRWDALGSAYQVLSFPGVDPVVTTDALTNGDTPNSDVLLAHLNTARDSLVMRVQRESYATPRATTVPVGSVLDTAVSRGLRVQFVGADVAGAQWAVSSELYPYLAFDQLTTVIAAQPTAGSYAPVVIVADLGSNNLSTVTPSQPAAGSYDAVVILRDLGSNNLSTVTAGQPPTASYDAVVIVADLGSNNLSTVTPSQPAAGSYTPVVIVADLGSDNLSTATISQPAGGTYGP